MAHFYAGSQGIAADSVVDGDTVLLEVVVGVSPDTEIIGDGSTHSVNLIIDWDGNLLKPIVPTFTVTYSASGIVKVSLYACLNISDRGVIKLCIFCVVA